MQVRTVLTDEETAQSVTEDHTKEGTNNENDDKPEQVTACKWQPVNVPPS
jgi:hypothetical protein